MIANLFDNDPRRISDRIARYALFNDPALGRVGMTEIEAHVATGRGREVLRAKIPMQRVGRAREAAG